MKVLVAVEDRAGMQAITSRLIAQMQPATTEVCLLHVVEPFPIAMAEQLGSKEQPDFVTARAEQKRGASALLEHAVAALHDAGFSHVSFVVEEGDVPDSILDEAARWECDLIIIGADHRTGLKRLLHGSVSDTIAHRAPCAVEIVPVSPDPSKS